MSSAEPQPVLTPLTEAAIILVLTVPAGGEDAVRDLLPDILPDDVKPANSHVALNTMVDTNGEERQIVRLNMPSGRVGAGEFGTTSSATRRTPM
jgi:deferrochelatase/peroxidase EfeB